MKGGYTARAPGYTEHTAEPGRFKLDHLILLHEGEHLAVGPARQIMLASVQAGGGMVPAVMMTIPGAALAYTMDAMELRGFARRMIELADQIERAASEAAAAALRKAAGK